MNLTMMTHRVTKFVSDNSATILTAIGVAGTVTTAVLATRATAQAMVNVNKANLENNVHDLYMPRSEFVKLNWKLYIPAVAVGGVTVTSVVMANHINTKRLMALAAAYSLSERDFGEYKTKVLEKLGIEEEKELRHDIARDRHFKASRDPGEPLVTGTGDILFRDGFSGRQFFASKEAILRAENVVNRNLHRTEEAYLTQFYEEIGLSPTSMSGNFGWSEDKYLEIEFVPVAAEDGEQACFLLEYELVPMSDFWRGTFRL